MARKPTKATGARVFNIIELLRGNIDFSGARTTEEVTPVAYGSGELISVEARSKILSGAFRAVDSNAQRLPTTAGSLLNIVQNSLSQVTQSRLENRKILQLMPEVDKAARLMVASIFSPNDLSRNRITVTFDCDDISDEHKVRLTDAASDFFQKRLNLKTEAPRWVYQFGYEAGSVIYAVIPLRSFAKIQEDSYIGTEAFVSKVIEPLCTESFFGFGDSINFKQDIKADATALESFTSDLLISEDSKVKDRVFESSKPTKEFTTNFVEKFIAHESLGLTDNPSILQANNIAHTKRAKRVGNVIRERFKPPSAQTVLPISSEIGDGEKGGPVGNPILMNLPPESVTVIHTPGNPSDHQGYLVLLDHTGNPINAVMMEEDAAAIGNNFTNQHNNIFTQTYNAYGLAGGMKGMANKETMSRIYTEVVSEHIRKRLNTAGFESTELKNTDAVFQCMFGRFLQQKQTRILFLPKDLVAYMTFEKDENGYGISRLERIKFTLGMKMAVQVSRVLAAIKAAMDRRRIEIKFSDNLIEQPEAVINNVIREYVNKSTISFSTDPNAIQSQIADKSLSIKGVDIPGLETFDLTNEPDARTASVDFDPTILEYLDKNIVNGLHVPAAAMNSLDDNEYARSVTTTNLFFSMDVSIDQDTAIRDISDLLRKYARYSEEFHNELFKIVPSLDKSSSNSSTDEGNVKKKDDASAAIIPEHYSLDDLIETLVITLPKPNVAPSKAQFEALDAMISSITTMVNAMFPDELAGVDDSLRQTVSLLRARFIADNVRRFLDGSGMSDFTVPDTNFSMELGSLATLVEALQNVQAMLESKANLKKPAEPDEGGAPPGYE